MNIKSSTIEIVAKRLADQLLRMYGLDGFLEFLKPEPTIDDRLKKLAAIQRDLNDALMAVSELQENTEKSKKEADALQREVECLREDKAVAEGLIKVPEEAFARLLSRATARSRGRGLLEGIVVGLMTGVVSSLIVWYFTTNN